MPGVTAHIFMADIRDILEMWNTQLISIACVLPQKYSEKDVIEALKTYYPHEWYSVEMKYLYYTQKDKCLKKRFGKARYNMEPVEQLLQKSQQYNTIMSSKYREWYSNSFSEEALEKEKSTLWKKREGKIQRIDKKIEHAKLKVQQVTPAYIDQLIGLYERKNTSQKDRLYILRELKKYYSPPIVQFFYKLCDTELNKQLRWEAFYHLQSFNYHPRARRQKYMQIHTNNKKRRHYLKYIYPDERFDIVQTPDELEYRINNAKEQLLKEYDFFISHSYMDCTLVQKLIQYENCEGKDIFCDWINDSDYLNRHLLCEATLMVIEKRLQQSRALLFVESDNSTKSVWCRYELNYFYELGRPIYTISANKIANGDFTSQLETNNWFLDPKYKELALLAAAKNS